MTRGTRTANRLVWVGLLLACAGCSTQTAPAASTSPTAASSAPGEAPTTPAPLVSSSASATAAADDLDGGPAIPDRTAGPLSQESFPTPRALGPGWRYDVDPGDAEEGYRGNGTPALERDPDEVVMTAVPLGCPRRATLPTPSHVLEVDYRFGGTRVIALRLVFSRSQDARTFHRHRRDILTACRGRSGGHATGDLVRTVRLVARGTILSDRTPDSDPWSELAVLDGSQVVMIASRSRLDRPPLTLDRAPALAATFIR